MEFEWNPLKNQQNIAIHQVDFHTAAAIFAGDVLTRIDDRRDYGETRFVSISFAESDCYVVVWTPRGTQRRIISAWKGGRDEQRAYRALHPGRNSGDEPPR